MPRPGGGTDDGRRWWTLQAGTGAALSGGATETQEGRLGGSAARRLGGSAARRLGGSAARRLGGSAARRLGGSAARRLGGSAARRLGGSAARRLGGSAAQLYHGIRHRMIRPKPRACRDPARWPRTPIPAIAPSTDRRPRCPSRIPPKLSRGAARTPISVAYPACIQFISYIRLRRQVHENHSISEGRADPRCTPPAAVGRHTGDCRRTKGRRKRALSRTTERSRTARSWCSEEQLCSECGSRQRLFRLWIRSSDQTESGLIRKAAQQSASDSRFSPAHLRSAERPVHLFPPNAAERSSRSGTPVPSCSRPGSTPATTPKSSPDARSTSTRPLGEP